MNGSNYNGTTLLHVAVSKKSDKTVDLLLKHGADYLKKDRQVISFKILYSLVIFHNKTL